MQRTNGIANWLMLTVVSLLPTLAGAQTWEGTRQFGVSLWAPDSPADAWSVTVTAWNAGVASGSQGQVKVAISGAATLVSGDLVKQLPPPGKGPTLSRWTLVLHRNGSGKAEVRGEVRIAGGPSDSYELHEAILVFDVSDAGARVVDNRTVRQVSVRHGRKFRYAGPTLVALDGDQDEDPAQMSSRAQLLRGMVIRCQECALREAVQVPVALTIGKAGKATWISMLDQAAGGRSMTAMRSAVERGLRDFEFRPAVSEGKPIEDFIFLSLTVAPSER